MTTVLGCTYPLSRLPRRSALPQDIFADGIRARRTTAARVDSVGRCTLLRRARSRDALLSTWRRLLDDRVVRSTIRTSRDGNHARPAPTCSELVCSSANYPSLHSMPQFSPGQCIPSEHSVMSSCPPLADMMSQCATSILSAIHILHAICLTRTFQQISSTAVQTRTGDGTWGKKVLSRLKHGLGW